MPTIEDAKRSWLIDALGTDANASRSKSTADLEREFLHANSGLSPLAERSLSDHWQSFLTAESVAGPNSIQSRLKAWADTRNGSPVGSLNDALNKMFLEVPFSAPALPIPSENLLALYDWTTASATPTTWDDSSGNGNHLTAVGLTYKTGGGILLYGSYYSLAAGLLGGQPAGHTLYMKASVGGFLPSILIEEVNVNRLELNASNQLRLSQSTSGTAYTHNSAGTTPTLAVPEWAVINYVGGSDFNIYKEKTLVTPDTTGPAGNLGNNANAFTIGAGAPWIDIKCVAIYSVAHDNVTRESIIDTINSVWT